MELMFTDRANICAGIEPTPQPATHLPRHGGRRHKIDYSAKSASVSVVMSGNG